MVGRVARINISPVKSLHVANPDEVELGRAGVVGDRRFWLVDTNGRLFNGKRGPELMRVHAEWDEASRRLALEFPDGAVVEDEVELGDAVEVEMYGTPHPSRLVVGPWQEALSRFVGEPLAFLWSDGGAQDRGNDRGGWADTGVSDLDTLNTLAAYRREGVVEPLPFGVYCDVVVPGRVRVGDAVRALERDPVAT